MAKDRYILRFNLGAGPHFQKWKLTHPSGSVKYYDPSDYTIVLTGCKLRNSPATATKIFKGDNKTVCAWIEAEMALVMPIVPVQVGVLISFNPRICPNWQVEGESADNAVYKTIISSGRKLFAVAGYGVNGLSGIRKRK